MKKLTYPLFLAAALTFVGCADDNEAASVVGDYKITLGDASNGVVTRAGFSGANTLLKLHFVSDKAYSNDDAAMTTNPLYMSTIATAKVSSGEYSDVVYGTTGTEDLTYARYWDNMHGKNSALSIYGIAVPNKNGLTNTCADNKAYFAVSGSGPWNTYTFSSKTSTETTISNDVIWQISATQTTATFADEDLTYTNNDQNPNSVTAGATGDSRLRWSGNVFEKANGEKAMQFNHALSRITLQIKPDATFTDADPFLVTAVKLQGFYDKGTLNVKTGGYVGSTTNAMDIVGSTTTVADGYKKAYTGLVGSTTEILESNTATMLTIVVDNNSYNVPAKDIATAIKVAKSDFTALQQGVNYVLQITISKKKIEAIQAKLAAWEDVTGSLGTLSNARITISSEVESETGVAETVVNYDLWKSLYTYNPTDPTNTADIDAVENYDYKTGYNAATGGSKAMTKSDTDTGWFWPSNLSFYHFRSISPQGTTITTATDDYITLTSGQQTDANDWIWGAPLKKKTAEGYVYDYSTKGYGNYVYKAIGPTDDNITLTQFHMMSNIIVNLVTETTGEGDAKTVADGGVDLKDAKIYLVRFSETGQMKVGDAFITPSNTIKDKSEMGITTNTSTGTTHTFRVVPQAVTRGASANDKIGLLIVTADKNTYVVSDLSSIIEDKEGGAAITRWLPGYAYQYTFKISKKQINAINAKLVDWTTVTGTLPSDITLES